MSSSAFIRNKTSLVEHISPDAKRVRQALIDSGIETPVFESKLSRKDQLKKITQSFDEILSTLSLDVNDDSLSDTPKRIAKMFVDEIFSGLNYSNFPKISVIENKMNTKEMVKVKGINMISTCEHHFVTIDGMASVAYIPNDKIIGLSKINRLVRFFSQRPQVQERLTEQIKVSLQTLLNTEDVAVHIDATHYCVKARGVMDTSSRTETFSFGGKFNNDKELKRDFLNHNNY